MYYIEYKYKKCFNCGISCGLYDYCWTCHLANKKLKC